MSHKFSFLIIAMLAAAVLAPLPVAAFVITPGEEGELANFVPPEDGARACFARSYDAAHMAKHPRQTVAEMQFRLTYYVHEPDEFYPQGQRNYYFELKARQKGQSQILTAAGDCFLADGGKAIFCGVDCDGGGVTVSRTGDAGKILVDLTTAGRLRMTVSCDEEEDAVELTPGEDDKTFLLTETPPAECPVYEDW